MSLVLLFQNNLSSGGTVTVTVYVYPAFIFLTSGRMAFRTGANIYQEIQ